LSIPLERKNPSQNGCFPALPKSTVGRRKNLPDPKTYSFTGILSSKTPQKIKAARITPLTNCGSFYYAYIMGPVIYTP